MQTIAFSSVQSDATLVILEDGKVRSYSLKNKNNWTIGRPTDENNPDIPLYSKIAGRKHAELKGLGADWFYIDKGSINGTYYNGSKIKTGINGSITPVPLNNGDVLRIDSDNLNYPDSRGVWMLFTTDNVMGEWCNYSLNNREVIIGRNQKKCDIAIDLPYISEQHCKITYLKNKYYLSDCDSMAGTWLNNKKIKSATVLKEKDKISLCDKHFIFTGNSLVYTKFRKSDIKNCNDKVMLKADIITKVVNNSNGRGKKRVNKRYSSGNKTWLTGCFIRRLRCRKNHNNELP